MGCDIHFVVEKKHPDLGWVGILSTEAPYDWQPKYDTRSHIWLCRGRNYDFFNEIAGVRGDGPAEPLGLPDDASALTEMHFGEDSDLHSHSHLPLQEFTAAWLRTNQPADAVRKKMIENKDPVLELLQLETEYDGPISEYRVCFAFDN